MSTATEQERPTGVREVDVGVGAATDGGGSVRARPGRRLGSGAQLRIGHFTNLNFFPHPTLAWGHICGPRRVQDSVQQLTTFLDLLNWIAVPISHNQKHRYRVKWLLI